MPSSESSQAKSSLLESQSPLDIRWTIAQSLLTANSQTTQVLEYLLLATYQENGTLDLGAMQAGIRQAQNEHQQILEELQLAEQAVRELQENQ